MQNSLLLPSSVLLMLCDSLQVPISGFQCYNTLPHRDFFHDHNKLLENVVNFVSLNSLVSVQKKNFPSQRFDELK